MSFFSSILAAAIKIRSLQEVAAKRRSTGQLFKHLDPLFLHRVPGLIFFPLYLVKRWLFLKAQDQGRMCHFSLHQKVLGTWGLSCLLLPHFLSLLTRGSKCGSGMVPQALGSAFCCFPTSRADLKTQNKDLDVLSCLSACVTRTFWASPRSAEPDFVHLQHLPSVLCPKWELYVNNQLGAELLHPSAFRNADRNVTAL